MTVRALRRSRSAHAEAGPFHSRTPASAMSTCRKRRSGCSTLQMATSGRDSEGYRDTMRVRRVRRSSGGDFAEESEQPLMCRCTWSPLASTRKRVSERDPKRVQRARPDKFLHSVAHRRAPLVSARAPAVLVVWRNGRTRGIGSQGGGQQGADEHVVVSRGRAGLW